MSERRIRKNKIGKNQGEIKLKKYFSDKFKRKQEQIRI